MYRYNLTSLGYYYNSDSCLQIIRLHYAFLHMTLEVFQEISKDGIFTDQVYFSLFIIASSGRFYKIFEFFFKYVCFSEIVQVTSNDIQHFAFHSVFCYSDLLAGLNSPYLKRKMLETLFLKEHAVNHLVFSFVKMCHTGLKASTKK